MKISEVWKTYEFYTEKLTEQGRKLAFAIAAICWFFKTPEITFPEYILYSLLFVVSFLLFDLLQYLIGALLNGVYARYQEIKMWKQKHTIMGDIEKPAWIDKPVVTLFIIKNVILVISGWFLVLEFLCRIPQK